MSDATDSVPGMAAPTGRVALVTGGGRGVGAALVRGLAARGHAVAIHCHASLREARSLAAECESAGVRSLALTADMRDEGAVRVMVRRAADHFGRIDAIVTCARLGRPCPFEDLTAEDLRNHYAVTCVGGFVTVQEGAAVMQGQATGGAIVMLADVVPDRPEPGSLAAAAAAGAVPALVRALAVEFAARQRLLRINCLVATRSSDTPDEVARAALVLLADESANGLCMKVAGAAAG
jgi:pteridine reductase